MAFWNRPTTPAVPRRKSGKRLPFEERAKRRADEILTRRMLADPRLELAYANKWLGMDIQPPPPVDEVEEKKKALEKAKLEQETFWSNQRHTAMTSNLPALQDDPDVQEATKQVFIAKIMEGIKLPPRSFRDSEGEDGYYDERSGRGEGPLDDRDVLARADELEDAVEERRKRHGGNGVLGSIMTPEVMSVLAGVVAKIFLPGMSAPQIAGPQQQYLPPGQAPEPQVVPYFFVETADGKVHRMNQEEFRAHRAAQAKAAAPPVSQAPQPVPPAPQTQEESVIITPPPQPQAPAAAEPVEPPKEGNAVMVAMIKGLMPQFQPLFDEINGATKGPAEQYFQYFLRQASGNVGYYPAIYNYLMTHNYEDIISMVDPYRGDPDLAPYIATLENNVVWVVEFIGCVQDREEENDPDTGGRR
jgi:hypothetical protein